MYINPKEFLYSDIDHNLLKNISTLINMSEEEIINSFNEYEGVINLFRKKIIINTNIKEYINNGIYIFGANKVGKNLALKVKNLYPEIKILGFLDNDKNKINQFVDNIKILSPDQLINESSLIIVASGRYSNEIILSLNNIENPIINLHHFQYCLNLPHQAENNFSIFNNFNEEDIVNYIKVFSILNDIKSKKVLNAILLSRQTLDISNLQLVKDHYSNEYLESEFVTTKNFTSYVDVGSYDGDTLDRIELRHGELEESFLFEPEWLPYIDSLNKYSKRKNVKLFHMGLSDKYQKFTYLGEHSFSLDYTSNSVTSVQTFKGDDFNFIKPTLIKIDVEGHESSVIDGFYEKINKFKPILVVCGYHRYNDIPLLTSKILKINPSYKVGLRHYSDILDDTTIYFY